MSDDLRELYAYIIKFANFFLDKTVGLQFDIRTLQEHNPSFDEVANIARLVATNIELLAERDSFDSQSIAIDSKQIAYLMGQIASGITQGDKGMVEQARSQLDKMPFLMYSPGR